VRKFVPENIEELKEWVSSDTGFELYADHFGSGDERELSQASDDDIGGIIPSADCQFTPASFSEYVDILIQAIPENPMFIAKTFDLTLKQHPYLTHKAMGFNSKNPFEPSIEKFIQALNRL